MPIAKRNSDIQTVILLAIGLALQVLVYCLQPTGWITVLSGVAGVFSVVLCASGRILTFLFGFVQISTYLWLSWQEKLWAEVAMNIFYLLSQFYGFFFWKHRMNANKVQARRLSLGFFALISGVSLIVSTLTGWLLGVYTTDSQPWLDAFTTIPAIVAQVLMVMAYREQWYLWLFVDILAVIMWIVAGNYALAALYLFWCVNCLYGLHKWR